MAKLKEKVGKNGETMHFSVGAIIENEGKFLLIDRKMPPFGHACIGGHIDEGETPKQALFREVKEESNLDIVTYTLLYEEFLHISKCWRGIIGHDWKVFLCTVSGTPKAQEEEVKSIGWYTPQEVKKFTLTKSWDYWLKKYGII